jgi:hypothetical protein
MAGTISGHGHFTALPLRGIVGGVQTGGAVKLGPLLVIGAVPPSQSGVPGEPPSGGRMQVPLPKGQPLILLDRVPGQPGQPGEYPKGGGPRIPAPPYVPPLPGQQGFIGPVQPTGPRPGPSSPYPRQTGSGPAGPSSQPLTPVQQQMAERARQVADLLRQSRTGPSGSPTQQPGATGLKQTLELPGPNPEYPSLFKLFKAASPIGAVLAATEIAEKGIIANVQIEAGKIELAKPEPYALAVIAANAAASAAAPGTRPRIPMGLNATSQPHDGV